MTKFVVVWGILNATNLCECQNHVLFPNSFFSAPQGGEQAKHPNKSGDGRVVPFTLMGAFADGRILQCSFVVVTELHSTNAV